MKVVTCLTAAALFVAPFGIAAAQSNSDTSGSNMQNPQGMQNQQNMQDQQNMQTPPASAPASSATSGSGSSSDSQATNSPNPAPTNSLAHVGHHRYSQSEEQMNEQEAKVTQQLNQQQLQKAGQPAQ